MSIPLDWEDFKDWRDASLNYHAYNPLNSYNMVFNYFEFAREFYQVKGFPKREKYKTGKKAGQYKPLSKDFIKQHEEERQTWIKRTAEKKGLKPPTEL